jgi:2-methylisocitrate lyase-like PEP mutase family enzyme
MPVVATAENGTELCLVRGTDRSRALELASEYGRSRAPHLDQTAIEPEERNTIVTVPTALAADLRALHVPGDPVVLVNAWDAASARIVEASGAPAVATTSAGVAWSLGVPDGGVLDRDSALDAVARIVRSVRVPVTADIEDGFGDDPADVARTVERLRATGAVGANIEDARGGQLLEIGAAADRVAAAGAAGGGDFFLNVRIDTFLLAAGDPADRLEATLHRAAAFVAAGADGIFVPGTADAGIIVELVAGIDAPLNVTGSLGGPTVKELAGLGVARISTGSATALTAYGALRRVLEGIPDGYDTQVGGVGYGELNDLLARR